MNEKEVKQKTFKIMSFGEFPWGRMDAIVNAICSLGYTTTIVENGNIVFESIEEKE